MSFFDEVTAKSKDAFDTAVKFTSDVVSEQKAKVQIASLKSKISRDYETLGRLYHDVIKNGSENEEAINEIIAEIEDKKQEICGLEEKIGKNDKVKICEKCSWKNPADAVFCNKCGEQL